jgi:peptidoglycan/LPS O-acetylase OafA/YrhL
MRPWSHGAWTYFLALFSATALLTIAISHALYESVEKPAVDLGRRLGGATASPAVEAR